MPGELLPHVGLDPLRGSSVTNLTRSAEGVVAFYNHRGTAEQWIKEGKAAIRWTRLSYRGFAANAVRLQLHALAYNLGTLMRTLVLPEGVERWTLNTLRESLVKIGAKVVSHGRYVTFQMARWRCRGGCSRRCCGSSAGWGRRRRRREGCSGRMWQGTTGEVRLDAGKAASSSPANRAISGPAAFGTACVRNR